MRDLKKKSAYTKRYGDEQQWEYRKNNYRNGGHWNITGGPVCSRGWKQDNVDFEEYKRSLCLKK